MASKHTTVKPWSGRFSAGTDSFVEEFTESVSFDRRLWRHDIEGSMAHARMLARAGVLAEAESVQICGGLEAIRGEIESGGFEWRLDLEDVHMNIESALVARIGEVGKKLHTGRSRNDQVATDLRLYVRVEIDEIVASLRSLVAALADLAEREVDTIMPGFTHMQMAQPVTFGHHMLAWCAMLQRDVQRLGDCRRRVDVLPLGAAALAGTGFPIDRQYTARLLGFAKVAENSLDAVSDRDFAVEFCADAALILMHLSRFSEELVLWISPQFGFIDLDDAWCTGSSIMPQKKNPDVPELVRGKTGRVYGDLLALLTIMKGQPLAYNRDNQEDKPALFDSIDTVRSCLRAYCGLVPGIRVQREVLRAAAARGLGTATDLADYLVGKGVPFRTAHAVVGRIVQFATEQGRDLTELKIEELRRFSEQIGADVFARLELQGSVNARDHIGGTAPAQVRQALQRLRAWLAGAGDS